MMLGLTALPNSAISQQWSIKDQLVGTWTLASWEHALPNGSKVQSYGTNPKGIVVFDAKGRFFLMFARPDLPKIAMPFGFVPYDWTLLPFGSACSQEASVQVPTSWSLSDHCWLMALLGNAASPSIVIAEILRTLPRFMFPSQPLLSAV